MLSPHVPTHSQLAIAILMNAWATRLSAPSPPLLDVSASAAAGTLARDTAAAGNCAPDP